MTTSNYDKISRMVKFREELNNRQRIFADSNKIADTTNDFTVFERRMDSMREFIEWSYKMVREGMPANVNMSYDEAIADFNHSYNENAVRIAKHISSEANTPQKIKNRIPKLEHILSSIRMVPTEEAPPFQLKI